MQVHRDVVGQLAPHAQDYTFWVLYVVYVHHHLSKNKYFTYWNKYQSWQRMRLAFGRSRVQIPWPTNLVEVFSGYLNLKLVKELVIFKDKCWVGPHVPLLMI